jgi:hypothetical protein
VAITPSPFELEWVMSDHASSPTTSAAAPARMVLDLRVMLAPFVGCVNSVTQRACGRTAGKPVADERRLDWIVEDCSDRPLRPFAFKQEDDFGLGQEDGVSV